MTRKRAGCLALCGAAFLAASATYALACDVGNESEQLMLVKVSVDGVEQSDLTAYDTYSANMVAQVTGVDMNYFSSGSKPGFRETYANK